MTPIDGLKSLARFNQERVARGRAEAKARAEYAQGIRRWTLAWLETAERERIERAAASERQRRAEIAALRSAVRGGFYKGVAPAATAAADRSSPVMPAPLSPVVVTPALPAALSIQDVRMEQAPQPEPEPRSTPAHAIESELRREPEPREVAATPAATLSPPSPASAVPEPADTLSAEQAERVQPRVKTWPPVPLLILGRRKSDELPIAKPIGAARSEPAPVSLKSEAVVPERAVALAPLAGESGELAFISRLPQALQGPMPDAPRRTDAHRPTRAADASAAPDMITVPAAAKAERPLASAPASPLPRAAAARTPKSPRAPAAAPASVRQTEALAASEAVASEARSPQEPSRSVEGPGSTGSADAREPHELDFISRIPASRSSQSASVPSKVPARPRRSKSKTGQRSQLTHEKEAPRDGQQQPGAATSAPKDPARSDGSEADETITFVRARTLGPSYRNQNE